MGVTWVGYINYNQRQQLCPNNLKKCFLEISENGILFKLLLVVTGRRLQHSVKHPKHPDKSLSMKFALNFLPAGIYMFKVNNGNTRMTCGICSKLVIKIPELD